MRLAHPRHAVLLERGLETEAIVRVLDCARSGNGSLLIIDGPAGIGKTHLLAAAAVEAERAGVAAAAARGAEIERDFAYGIVRQLFEPRVLAASAAERAELFAGAAALAAGIVDTSGDAEPISPSVGGDRAFAALHGLYWLTANLAQRRPLALLVDDAQWADAASLAALGYLARRLAGLPVAVILATRRPSWDVAEELLNQLAADPLAEVVRPGPLSEAAVAQLLASELDEPTDPAFSQACREATGGVPFLVHELIRALRDDRVRPTAAHLQSVRDAGPPTVARRILARLRRLSPAAVALARAAAILGPSAQLRHAAALAGIDNDHASEATDLLLAAEILSEASPLTYSHPIVQQAVAGELTAAARAEMHLRAAHLLAAEPGGEEAAATHLLDTLPMGSAWTVDVLCDVARGAFAQGAAHSAVAYLRRALAEPPAADRLAHVLRDLGFAESYAGDPLAAVHLTQAREHMATLTEYVNTAIALGRILQLAGEHKRATDVYSEALMRVDAVDEEATLTVEGALVCAALLDAATAAIGTTHAAALRRRARATRDPPSTVFGPLAFAAAGANENAPAVIALARRAVNGGARLLPEAVDRPPFFYYAAAALIWAEAHGEAQQLLDDSVADAQRLGSLPHFVGLSACRAWLALRRGALADAEADARLALTSQPDTPVFFRALALGVLIATLVERGQPDAAALEDRTTAMPAGAESSISAAVLLWSRGLLLLRVGRPSEALAELRATGRHLAVFAFTSPSVVPWRSTAALAHVALGELDAARELAAEELALARAFGGRRAVGCALRASGLATPGADGIALLEDCVRQLAGADAAVDEAAALVDLGAALRRDGQRVLSRDPLRRGLDLAHRCGAAALAARARDELLATGARPRRPSLSGVDALTPSERRVAQMAAEGLTNRQIAQALFVTTRTIEGHLTRIFEKLAVAGRGELPAALA